jgi:hypothetical protein
MDGKVSAADKDYMRRLGEFKAAGNLKELQTHRRLSINQRLTASERLSKRAAGRDAGRAQQDDLAAFFLRARELGLCGN